ncbi:hypothetical protein ACYULU_07430 [Breznakiellaceae bacterium SP9]
MSGHYKLIQSVTSQSGTKQKNAIPTASKHFHRNAGAWFYTLVISLLPFLIVFFFFTGPPKRFCFLEFFRDNALIYVCVTMSATSLYTYKKKDWVAGLHIILLLFGMAIYVISTTGVQVPLYVVSDRRVLIAVFFGFSIVLGLLTIVYSSIKGENW